MFLSLVVRKVSCVTVCTNSTRFYKVRLLYRYFEMAAASSTDGGGVTEEVVAATYKVLVLGNSNVGKTSLIKAYASGVNSQKLLPTIGMDFSDVVVSVRGTKVKLRIWDTVGQERFFTFTKQFFRGTQGIVLVYDVSNMDSFKTLMRWTQTIDEEGLRGVGMIVVGNKCDLESVRQVPMETAKKLADRDSHPYIETSVKTGKNIKKAFYKLAENLIHTSGIFQPGQEATNLDECGTMSTRRSASATPERSDESFTLTDETKSKHSCCKKT